MIVPSNRMIVGAAVVVLPSLTIFSAFPAFAATTVSLLVVALFLAAAIMDARLGRRSFNGLTFETPGLIRLTRGREGKISIKTLNETPKGKTLRVLLELPKEIFTPAEEMNFNAPADGGLSLSWPATPIRRGSFQIKGLHIETPSPLGLWLVRKRRPIETEIRVYPDLSSDKKYLSALFLKKSAFGVHARRQIGKGREFEKLREYAPGDGYEDIHWKATARRGHPITKVYQIERTQEVYVFLDASRLSGRTPSRQDLNDLDSPTDLETRPSGSQPGIETTILERFVASSLTLCLAAESQGDLFGVGAFSDNLLSFVRARNGKAHYSACRDALYTLHPRGVAPDFEELFAALGARLRRRALVFFLTNLDDPTLAESFLKNVEKIGRQHLIMAAMVRPPGARPLFSNPKIKSEGDIYADLAGHMKWSELDAIKKALHHKGIAFSLINGERLGVELVSQYIDVKRRQLL